MARLKSKRLRDAYRFAGFVPLAAVQGVFGDPKAVIVKLSRRRKKRCAVNVVSGVAVTTTTGSSKCGICRVETGGFTWEWTSGEWTVGPVEV
jgi:hypothetical protein